MYPERPQSVADLVPLPQGNGPKIKAFDFQGPQQIEFLDHLGSGIHSIVFKVKIRGQIYALKLATHPDNRDDPDALGAFYPYSEPFTCECRAFGRLQETGYEELAVKCFGYILLDDAHERTMMSQFAYLPAHKLSFTWDGYHDDDEEEYYKDRNLRDMRTRFRCTDGSLPPIRGIVKEFGESRVLDYKGAKSILRDIKYVQQLGITDLDLAHRQIINGKLSDFSTSITVPHFASNPEWNRHLSRSCRSKIEFELFATCYKDFRDFDIMIHDWNEDHKDQKDKQINLKALPEGFPPERRRLRNTSAQRRLNTHVDPRNYTRYLPYTNRQGQIVRRTFRALARKPSVWYMECSAAAVRRLEETARIESGLHWQYQNGHIVPLDQA
ncbi:kinetochore complex Sim4 subunit Fta2 [Fusarium pseudoanthophilum]|uniref:Kinetochore complex Sim4 subunit Fta2 n=1 Tax=Fusarium pseudoanthophilum TaxID=48495 RepID=A0A8H5PPU0_9HYPO|nr:kinetochore complex Sim4 subunit Fta2 [Fusarium pseudoanthophilum]